MTEESEDPPIFTPERLAKRWGCSEQHVRNMISSGKLPAFKVGKLLRVRRAVVEAFEPRSPPHTRREEGALTASDGLAYPPRGMSEEEAARYVGVSVPVFGKLVADKRMPRPKSLEGRMIWDRVAIDAAFSDLPSGP